MNTYTTTPGQVKGQTLTVLMASGPREGVIVCRFDRTADLRVEDGTLYRLGYTGSPITVVGVR